MIADALAAYRLTRLATADVLLADLRDLVVETAYRRRDPQNAEWIHEHLGDVSPGDWAEWAINDPDAPKIATLVTCRWCAGVWVSFFVVAARRLAPRAWSPVARGLAFSALAALLAGLEDD